MAAAAPLPILFGLLGYDSSSSGPDPSSSSSGSDGGGNGNWSSSSTGGSTWHGGDLPDDLDGNNHVSEHTGMAKTDGENRNRKQAWRVRAFARAIHCSLNRIALCCRIASADLVVLPVAAHHHSRASVSDAETERSIASNSAETALRLQASARSGIVAHN